MTPKEKAEELVRQFVIAVEAKFTEEQKLFQFRKQQACALIAVDEIIKELQQLRKPEYTIFLLDGTQNEEREFDAADGYQRIDFWEQVKIEIKNL